MDIDIKKTKEYYQTHSLCDCPCCRNYYAQVKQRFQLVDELLSVFGVSIECPDELGSVELQDEIQYIFASYTVCGKILELDKYEIDINDGGLFLNIVIGDDYIRWIIKKAREFQKNIYFCFIDYAKAFDCGSQ